jgi:hypothetical protein
VRNLLGQTSNRNDWFVFSQLDLAMTAPDLRRKRAIRVIAQFDGVMS